MRCSLTGRCPGSVGIVFFHPIRPRAGVQLVFVAAKKEGRQIGRFGGGGVGQFDANPEIGVSRTEIGVSRTGGVGRCNANQEIGVPRDGGRWASTDIACKCSITIVIVIDIAIAIEIEIEIDRDIGDDIDNDDDEDEESEK